MRTTSLALSLFATLASGCAADLQPPEEEAQVLLAIASVPADVACVRITATGPGRVVARELDVTPGAGLTESFAGLPLGAVVFLAEAFPGQCDAVTKSTVPTWISEPDTVNIAVGRLATVNLKMHRNGRAKVGVEFAEEPDGGAPAGDAR